MITSLADLKPGDIGITRMGGVVPGFFPVRVGQMICKESYQVGPFSADHVLMCVEAGAWTREHALHVDTDPIEHRDFMDGRGPEFHMPGRAVQAMPRGAEEIALTPVKHWGPGVQWFRLPEDYPGQAQDAAAIARLFVTERVPYSFLSYLALAAWSHGLKAKRLERWIDKRRPDWHEIETHDVDSSTFQLPAEAICSVLVDQAWSLAGKRVLKNVERQCVTPGMMAIQLNRRPGIVRSEIEGEA